MSIWQYISSLTKATLMNRLTTTMRDALSLIRGGNLAVATDAIRHKLRQFIGSERSQDAKHSENFGTVDRSQVFEGDHIRRRLPDVESKFTECAYTCSAGSRRYKLFMPAGNYTSPLPLVVMLHGCTQTPDDFALGTGMNELAATRQCVIAYPEQAISANGMKCWNWFNSSDQRRDHGEPAIIAGLTREVLNTHGLDGNRVYVAGLSAGGAMAVVMGRTYPDLYAAVGVHSGVPYAVAHDAPSAFAAMKGTAPRPRRSSSIIPPLIPTIVLHGDRDNTVHPSNGEKLAGQFSAGDGAAEAEFATVDGHTGSEGDRVSGGRAFRRTLMRDKSGKVVVEYWLVHGAGHAWFGGNPLGSHTDPHGPDASKEILRFFLEHELAHRRR